MTQLPSVRTGENKLRSPLRQIPTRAHTGRPVQIYLREEGTKESEAFARNLASFRRGPAIKGSRGSG